MFEKMLVVGPVQSNCYLLVCSRTGLGVVIDPGDEPEIILKSIKELRGPSGAPVKIKFLFHTHGHIDHVAATREVAERLRSESGDETLPKILLHRADEPLYLQMQMQARFLRLDVADPLPVDRYLQDQEIIEVGDLRFLILHTPGHTPGGVSFVLQENIGEGIRKTVYSGDTLFSRSVGRTDLWGGNASDLSRSIRERLFTFDEDTRVCPGHGPETEIGIEKRENPFFS